MKKPRVKESLKSFILWGSAIQAKRNVQKDMDKLRLLKLLFRSQAKTNYKGAALLPGGVGGKQDSLVLRWDGERRRDEIDMRGVAGSCHSKPLLDRTRQMNCCYLSQAPRDRSRQGKWNRDNRVKLFILKISLVSKHTW